MIPLLLWNCLSLDPSDFPNIYICGGTIAFLVLGGLFVLSALTPYKKPTRSSLREKELIYDPRHQTEESFPLLLKEDASTHPIYTPSDVYLSVVIPAMNEQERLPIMLDECLEYCEERRTAEKSFTYEVIVVDDGSKDNTADIAAEYGLKHEGRVRALKLDVNRGKGGAVRVGVMHARGKLILFADADGATKFSDFKLLEQQMCKDCGGDEVDESFPGVVVGSRAHLEDEAKATRSLPRLFLMYGFHMLVGTFAIDSIRDTQCGFKLFTRAAASKLFAVIHVERWAFDVELLSLARRWKFSISEVCVTWHEVDGSKITPVWSWLQMGRDVVMIWFRYFIGIWNDKVPK